MNYVRSVNFRDCFLMVRNPTYSKRSELSLKREQENNLKDALLLPQLFRSSLPLEIVTIYDFPLGEGGWLDSGTFL